MTIGEVDRLPATVDECDANAGCTLDAPPPLDSGLRRNDDRRGGMTIGEVDRLPATVDEHDANASRALAAPPPLDSGLRRNDDRGGGMTMRSQHEAHAEGRLPLSLCKPCNFCQRIT